MPNPFDHIPERVDTPYGPSIHTDPVAMDNEALLDGGLVRVDWIDSALHLTVDARSLLTDLLVALATEYPESDLDAVLADIATLSATLRRLNNGTLDPTDIDATPQDLTEDLATTVDGLLDTMSVPLTASAVIRGPVAVQAAFRIIEVIPAPVILAWGRIERARRAAVTADA